MSHPIDTRSDAQTDAQTDVRGDALNASVYQDLLASLRQPVTLAALYRKFLANAAEFIRELPDQEHGARVETLHTLKGSAAMMGATRLAALSDQLQAQSQWSAVQVAQATQALQLELQQFRVAVSARLQALGVALDT